MSSEIQPRPETVLIVDDDARVVELLQITLGGRGYRVLAAYDGEKALAMVRQHHPDLLVCNVRLPRRSGFEILDSIRKDSNLRHLPVVLISADAATESRLQGFKLGADDYLAKPFSSRELIIKIRRILDRVQDRNLLLLKAEMLEDEVRRSRDTLLEMRQELRQNLNRMGTMLDSVVDLSRFRSIDEILERFVLTTVSNLEFEQVALLTPEDGRLRPRICRGVAESAVRQLTLDLNGPVARIATSVGRSLRIDELEGYPEAREEVLRLSAAGLTLVVPALERLSLCGLLGLGERRVAGPLGGFDHRLLEILGSAIVAALKNAESFEETQRRFLETTAGLITNLEERYPFVRGHTENVARLSLALGKELRLDEVELESLRYGALLHDLGQLEQYEELLQPSVLLSPSDRRLHRKRSAEHVEHMLGPGGQGAVGDIIRHHQEYWNGTGLPDGLRELEIPLGARIVALANAWDALTHDRPHRKAYAREEAFRILTERAGRQFDPELVPRFMLVIECASGLEVAS